MDNVEQQIREFVRISRLFKPLEIGIELSPKSLLMSVSCDDLMGISKTIKDDLRTLVFIEMI